jgi:DNA-binding response OmpR family regulator
MTHADAPRGTLILLVEDDAPTARLVAEALCEEQGFQVLILPDASFALSLVEAMPADLVLLDLNLPGIDGAQLHDLLRRDPASQHIPILFVTAKPDDRRLRDQPLSHILAKPFDLETLFQRVHALLPRPA